MEGIIKNKTVILTTLLMVGVGMLILSGLFYFRGSTKTIKTDSYSMVYNNSWKVIKKTANSINLRHSTDSTIDINISELDQSKKYINISDMIEDIMYDLEKNNKSYKLISKEETNLTKYEYDGYKLLYENKDSNAMITVYKRSDKLVIINYQAKNEYFDILLDSVNSIIYNFNLKDEEYAIKTNISVNTNYINYSKNDLLTKTLKKVSNYEIASNNYYVNYSIPSNFKELEFNSTTGFYVFDGKDINLWTSVVNKNIYQYINNKDKLSVYKEYLGYKDNKNYTDYQEVLSKIDNNTYIYKNSYTYKKDIKTENIIYIYALDKNHIFIIKIASNNNVIPKKLIDMIKINKYERYSSYIKSEKENNNLVSTLKHYSDYKNSKTLEVKISVPDKYKEIDNNNNKYKVMDYAYGYNKTLDLYDYEISYELTSINTNIEDSINSINKSFATGNRYNYLSDGVNFTVNNKDFIVYSGDYTNISGIIGTNIDRIEYNVNVKALFYKLSDNSYLIIKILGNNQEISNDLVNELINFEVK